MSEQKKLVVLGVLVLALIIVGVLVFASPSRKRSREAKADKTAREEGELAKLALPSEESIAALEAWLGASRAQPSIKISERGRFGLPAGARQPEPGASPAHPAPVSPGPGVVSMNPPELEGIIVVGTTPMAVFKGAPYRKGETIRNTGFKVAYVGQVTVTLANERDNVFILGLQK